MGSSVIDGVSHTNVVTVTYILTADLRYFMQKKNKQKKTCLLHISSTVPMPNKFDVQVYLL